MLGINLVVHAIKILFHDIWATVRLTVFPMIIGYGIAFGVVYLLPGDTVFAVAGGASDVRTTPGASFFLAVFLALVVMAISFCWAAVGWHRFVLLEEQPGAILPKFSWPYTQSYLWAAFRTFLVLFVIVFLVMFVLPVLRAIGVGTSVFLFVIFIITIISYVLFFRISLVLPGAAVGKPMSLRQSWNATSGQIRTFLVIVVLSVGFGFLAEKVLLLGYVGWIISVFLSWLSFAFGISILTTLYGVYVEKREL